jgi:predicted DNA-binding transcriptional regulator AlpA
VTSRNSLAIRNDTAPSDAASTLRNEVQAAAFLGVSPRALQKWRVTGQGPQYLRLSSRCIRYSQAELDRWIEARLCRATAQYGTTRAQRRPACTLRPKTSKTSPN